MEKIPEMTEAQRRALDQIYRAIARESNKINDMFMTDLSVHGIAIRRTNADGTIERVSPKDAYPVLKGGV
jgi:hypothetical protein